jgi:hypothetical protein
LKGVLLSGLGWWVGVVRNRKEELDKNGGIVDRNQVYGGW